MPSLFSLLVALSLAGATSPDPDRTPPPSTATAPRPGPLDLWIQHAGTGQAVRLRVVDSDGRLDYAALVSLRALFREAGTGRDHPVHWRLAVVLARLSSAMPNRPIVLVSGYRTHSRSARNSRHLRGRAADIRVPGVPARAVVAWLRRNVPGTGVGYYPNSTFVHVDVRDRDAFWVDYAGPGRPPCYDRAPARAFATKLADRLDEAEARRTRCRRSPRHTHDPARR